MKFCLHVTITLAAVLNIVSCQNYNANFSVDTPSGWVRSDSLDWNGRTVKMRSPVRSNAPAISENVNISSYHAASLLIFTKSIQIGLKRKALYYKSTGSGFTTVSGYNTKWVQHVVEFEESSSDRAEQRIYHIDAGPNIYQIVFTAAEGEINYFKFIIGQVLNSFVVLQ